MVLKIGANPWGSTVSGHAPLEGGYTIFGLVLYRME